MDIIHKLQSELTRHPVYDTLRDLPSIRRFMRAHVFAVWDFMSLLKALQREITCVEVPWKPSPHSPELVRLINQIVLGEESDLDQNGNPLSHFELYLRAMEEVGASTSEVRDFLASGRLEDIPSVARDFVAHNLLVAQSAHPVEIAASFFYGREKLIPSMFQSIVEVLRRESVSAPTLIYYLERHIEVDGDEHGPLAERCLDKLISGDVELESRAMEAGIRALEVRRNLWDRVLCSPVL